MNSYLVLYPSFSFFTTLFIFIYFKGGRTNNNVNVARENFLRTAVPSKIAQKERLNQQRKDWKKQEEKEIEEKRAKQREKV
jgi:hypothetical protein